MKENSRFKFRAWDYEGKRYVYGYYTKLVQGIRKYDAIVSEDGGSLVRYYIDDIKTLCQATGLKDKNGIEIYEFMEIDNLFEVSFCDGCYILTNISNKDIIHLNFYLKEKNGQVEVTKEYTKI